MENEKVEHPPETELTTQEKERLGKYGNLVRLDAWILANQDRKLDELAKLMGKSKGAVLRDLIALGIGHLENEGVL